MTTNTSEAKLSSARAYKENHRSEILEWQKNYNRSIRNDPINGPKRREQNNASNRKAYHEGKSYAVVKDPIKCRAQRLIRDRIYKGYLVRGDCCICCSQNADAHHEDYSKPREIYWLCRLHHKRVHLGEIKLNDKDMVHV